MCIRPVHDAGLVLTQGSLPGRLGSPIEGLALPTKLGPQQACGTVSHCMLRQLACMCTRRVPAWPESGQSLNASMHMTAELGAVEFLTYSTLQGSARQQDGNVGRKHAAHAGPDVAHTGDAVHRHTTKPALQHVGPG